MGKLYILLSIGFTILSFSGSGQWYYRISFSDKTNSPWSLSYPGEYLSEKALDRREKQGITIDSLDLPVNPHYIEQVVQHEVSLINSSKWLNSIVVGYPNNILPEEIIQLPFVKEVQVVKRPSVTKSSKNKFIDPQLKSVTINSDTSKYGESSHQAFQLNTQFLHKQDYRGQGMLIAVLDAGFFAVDRYPAFDSLRMDGRVSGTRDFVDGDQQVFTDHHHGMSVLSVMAGNIPGQLIGTAPMASYWLLRTEDATSEYLIEEDNWVAAAEFADSAGVDIINSSLGYSTFDDPDMDHTYTDMDGNTTSITRGANIAASRGILVFSSAGNEGSENNPWKYIVAPSDGVLVTAVGAVNKEGIPAPFSSWGPASDGDVKPNVSAVGWNTIVQRSNGTVGSANGTSFSSPVMAGAAACLWQANPEATAADIKEAIERSAHLFSYPDQIMGYGIPDLMVADSFLKSAANGIDQSKEIWLAYPNPATEYLIIHKQQKPTGQKLWLTVYTPDGRLVYEDVKTDERKFVLSNLQQLPGGLLFLHLRSGNDTVVLKILNSP